MGVLASGLLQSVIALPAAQEALQCNVYGDGSDFYTYSQVSNVKACIDTCEKDQKCRSFEFKPFTGRCWLYNKPTAQAKTREGKDWVFNDKGCGNEPQCGVYGDGSDFYTVSVVQNIEACIATCEKDKKCRSSEFKPSTGNCWLYSKPTAQAETREGKDWIFNDRGCAAPVCKLRGLHSSEKLIGGARDGLSLTQCLSACQTTDNCKAVQYASGDTYNKRCYLFSVNGKAARKTDDTTNVWHFYDRGCPATSS